MVTEIVQQLNNEAFPHIYLEGKFIGGSSRLKEIHLSNSFFANVKK